MQTLLMAFSAVGLFIAAFGLAYRKGYITIEPDEDEQEASGD
jgi:hypothetical protein